MDYTAVLDQITTLLPVERRAVALVIDTLVAVIRERAILSESITIPRLGKFHPHKQLEKIIVRPDTCQSYLLPPKITIRFYAFSRPSKQSYDLDVNTVLPYPSLVALLEKRSGMSQTVVESVIYRLTQLILEQDELRIDRFGLFRWVASPEKEKGVLLFIPEKSFLQDVNSPFNCFSILPLPKEKTEIESPKELESKESGSEPLIEQKQMVESLKRKKKVVRHRSNVSSFRIHRLFFWILLPLIGIVALVAVYAYYNPTYFSNILQSLDRYSYVHKPVKSEQPDNQQLYIGDTIEQANNDTLSLPEVSYAALDTIELRAGGRLTLLAQKYYKERNYWVYIYLENQSENPDPNNISQGASLIIPDLRKYGVMEQDSISVQRAKQLAIELLSRNR